MKKILVTGATGAQGASVARAILANGQFSVRIFTRNADSPRARELEMKGAELFQGDMFNKEDLLSAMHNCYGVFGVTNFWEHFDRETIIGTNLLDAAKNAAIEHLVFHTLADYSLLSKG
ncbi:NmrA family NAD(P)-binding protein [Flavihumibacter sp. UBA7668]|uniref:NmrA family NAD(P)-binding protein n=1 Tax=Flavihumibacter sp. UBA7668 TaxID=1946542 RepID=UPI0025BBA839|nr:NmrA family NAD(P)-binding protein [Flavihumibacter sp. UBA7668]